MAEMFNNPARDVALPVPEAVTLNLNAETLEWLPSGTERFWLKPLFEIDADRLRTWLMKVDPGAYSPMHAHEEIEQIYVIDGSFYDQHETYGPGQMIVRAPGAEHEAGSKTGGLMMVSYAPKA